MLFVLVAASLSILQFKHTPAGSQLRGEQLHSWEPPQSGVFPLWKAVAYDKEKDQQTPKPNPHGFFFIFPIETSSEASAKDLSQTPQPKYCDFSTFSSKIENSISCLPLWSLPVSPLHVLRSRRAAARSSCE